MKKTINIGGEERAVNFGTLFLYNYQEKHGENPLYVLNDSLSKLPKGLKDDEEAGAAFLKVFSFKFMVDVLICGLETGSEMGGAADVFDRATVCEWVDEAGGMELLGEAMGLMLAALPVNKKNGKAASVEAKKKTPKGRPVN